MAPRIRTIKPDIWQDETLGSLPPLARLLFIGLITQADDEGRFRAAVPLVRAAIFPFDADEGPGQLPGVALNVDVAALLAMLDDAGLVRLYSVKGDRYGELPNWPRHQRIKAPSPSQLPTFEQRSKPERTTPDAGSYPTPTPGLPQAFPLEVEREVGKELSGSGSNEPSPSSSSRSTVRSSDGMKVWNAYAQHHPRALLTEQRRRLIRSRLADGYQPDQLVAAIEGNHHDPHCNGDNERQQQYHSIELILRDAAHIERYADLAASLNGNGSGESRLERARKATT